MKNQRMKTGMIMVAMRDTAEINTDGHMTGNVDLTGQGHIIHRAEVRI